MKIKYFKIILDSKLNSSTQKILTLNLSTKLFKLKRFKVKNSSHRRCKIILFYSPWTLLSCNICGESLSNFFSIFLYLPSAKSYCQIWKKNQSFEPCNRNGNFECFLTTKEGLDYLTGPLVKKIWSSFLNSTFTFPKG